MENKVKLLLICLLSVVFVGIQAQSESYLAYIERYADIAIQQQERHGIPASITLAQGLLESRAGQSELTLKSNNHFGIKCHKNWIGERTYHNDDVNGECFRKYKDPKDSFEDHSQFLITRPRYASLFDLSPTDYRKWAYGLRAAGYATDRHYAPKLIKLIEEYELYKYDRKRGRKQILFRHSTRKQSVPPPQKGDEVPVKRHLLCRNNGVNCLLLKTKDSYQGVAQAYGVKFDKLLYYNDVATNKPLDANTIVYLKKKKKCAEKQFRTHIVQQGETFHYIAQKYGIRLTKLYKLNKLKNDATPTIGMVLKLR